MGNQNHDQQGRFASGDGSGGTVTNTVRERQAMRAMVDARRFAQGRTSNRNMNPTPMRATDVPHARGIVAATTGKALGSNADANAKFNQAARGPKYRGNVVMVGGT
jgi:hypothetical protein